MHHPEQPFTTGSLNFAVIGRETLQDAERSGRPCSATTEENVTAAQKLVEDDARITTAFIAAQLQISLGTVSTILHHFVQE